MPLDVYFNRSRGECTSVDIADLLNGVKTPRVQVVVKDAGGTVVGAKLGPKFGGSFSQEE
ncbi:MAG: hypothetical protein WKF54_09650 [Nocardioidaceae bacterium]